MYIVFLYYISNKEHKSFFKIKNDAKINLKFNKKLN